MIRDSWHRVPPTKSPRSSEPVAATAADAGHGPGRHVAAEPAQHRLGCGGQVGPAGAQQRELDRGGQPGGVLLDRGGHLGCRRLGDDHDQLDGGVFVEPAQRLAGGQPADLGRQVAAPDAEGRADADARVVEQREQLLAARPGRRHQADRSGRTTLANPSPSPPTTAVPQSGPITSRARSAATRLRATSWSTGTLSLKTITSLPASSASIASTVALAPGTETSTSDPGRERSAAPTVRGGASSLAPRRAAYGVCQRSLDAGQRAFERGLVVDAQGDDHLVGRRAGRDLEAHLAEHLDVEGRRHRDLRRVHTRHRLHVAADLEERHGVGVGTGAQLDVEHGDTFMRRPTLWSAASSACRAPHHSPAPEVWPTRIRAATAAGSPGRPTVERYAANSGSTSPCRAQSSNVAESSVVRGSGVAHRRDRLGVEPTGGPEHRQPTGEHVVA